MISKEPHVCTDKQRNNVHQTEQRMTLRKQA